VTIIGRAQEDELHERHHIAGWLSEELYESIFRESHVDLNGTRYQVVGLDDEEIEAMEDDDYYLDDQTLILRSPNGKLFEVQIEVDAIRIP
jgi:hypothetical protein